MLQTVEDKMCLIPILYSTIRCLKLPHISKLVDLNYICKTPLKIS